MSQPRDLEPDETGPNAAAAVIARMALVRHAATDWNRQKRIQGQTDVALSAEGARQAARWARHLGRWRWDYILCSDLQRARATADILNAAWRLPVVEDARLREQHWGQWTGKTVRELRRELPRALAEQERAGWDFRPPGGEDRRAVWERSRRALAAAARHRPGQTALVVCHEGVIKCVVYRLENRRFLPPEEPILRAYHLHWLRCRTDGLAIERLNAVDLNAGSGAEAGAR